MGMFFEQGGMLTTVQDEGRFNYQEFGVSPAGPMDIDSFHIANILVGNDQNESALELTYVGPRILFEEANVIAMTGAELQPRVNGVAVPNYCAIEIKAGDVLSFLGVKTGCRGYIAFAGGLDVPIVMGSKSTLIRNGIGGVDGRKLLKGDRVHFVKAKETLPNMNKRNVEPSVMPDNDIVLRVIRGPQENAFTEKGFKQFFWNSAEITNEFDRMGCRLECEAIEHVTDGNTITDGIVFGSIQIPSNGKPIIMLADCQSTGGYTKIGTVITVDLPKIAQSRPGVKVRFEEVSVKTAQDLYLKNYEKMLRLNAIINEI